MLTDKELAMLIIDQMEGLHLEVVVLTSVLDAFSVSDWRKHRDTSMANPEFRASVHEQYAQLRDRVLAAPDLTQAVRDILQTLDGDVEDQP